MYGLPALKVCGNLLTCLAIHKSAEPESLAVRIDFDQRAGLLFYGLQVLETWRLRASRHDADYACEC